jgi:hypothetical protein
MNRNATFFPFTIPRQNHPFSGWLFATDFKDFSDGKPLLLIRAICEIRGCSSLVAVSRAVPCAIFADEKTTTVGPSRARQSLESHRVVLG